MNTGLALLAALFLVLLNGFFVAAEFALVKVRSTRIAELANEGKASARMAMHAIHHLDAYLSATQLGITLASIGLGWIAEPAFHTLLEPVIHALHLPAQVGKALAFFIPFAIVSALHIVLGELAPKSWAIQQPERLSLAVAYPLHGFYWLFKPAISLLNGMASLLLRYVLRLEPVSEHELAHSEEELRMILQASGQSGMLKDSEVDLVNHVFEFADKKASEIMIPRVDMVYLDATWPMAKNMEITRSHTYTRYPLCNGDPDHVLGMIHIKDLLGVEERGVDIRDVKREMVFVPETKSIDQLLREFQLRKMHMAVVVDEYGGTAGLVTLEDVLEQIVGEIHDEHEEPSPEVQPVGDNAFLVDGKVLLGELRVDHHIELPTNGSETVGGWVVDRLGAIPEAGEIVEVEGYRIEVKDVLGQRVRQVLITRVAAPVPEPVEV